MRTSKIRQIAAAALITLAAQGAWAEGLTGRGVTFQVVTYDDPVQPIFEGAAHSATVIEGPEFGLGYEGTQNGVDVVPLLVDISDWRIELDYAKAGTGELMAAHFNGYVLTFQGKCAPIVSARVDRAATNIEFDNKRVVIDGNRLLLNVAALRYDPGSRIVLNLTLAACATS